MSKAVQYPHRALAFAGLVILFATIPLSAVAVVATISYRNAQVKAATPAIDITAGAVQKVHTNAVPQVDVNGNFKDKYSPDSFLPVGIYNPVLCKVTRSLSWRAPSGYSGEYRIKVHYGTSRAPGTYLIADINVGTVRSASVGNLPPNSTLHYSIWRQGTAQVVTEGNFTSTSCSNEDENSNFESIKNAGYNVGILEKNYYPDNNTLTRAQQASLKLMLDLRDRPNGTFSNLKDNANVFGFYVGDDDLARAKFYNTDSDPNNNVNVGAVYGDINTFASSLDAQTDKIVLAAEPDVEAGAGDEWLNWYRQFDAVGNVSFHYNYPKAPALGFSNVKTVADTVRHQYEVNGSNRPIWFISQAINLKWVIGLDFPSAVESRAMKYAAFVHGATGIFDFSYDGWFRRQPKGTPAVANQNDINWYDRHAGIKANTPISYPSGDKWSYSTTVAEQAQSIALWNGLDASRGGVNREIHQLAPVLLSNTSQDNYRVFVDKTPIPAPVRTILKEHGGSYYLIAVNLTNEAINTKFVLDGKTIDRVSVMYEGRSLSPSGENEISESFGAFDVNVYKIDLKRQSVDAIVKSQRQVCSLYGGAQISAGIGGQDGGTSIKIGDVSYWTFGDTVNLDHNLFLPNNAAKTTDTNATDCLSLDPKKNGSLASELYPKAGWELLSWPDGMINALGSEAHFYYMSVKGCSAPEDCAYYPLGSWKVRGIGLGKFGADLNSQRIGDCANYQSCLLWQEDDNLGFEIAGATAAVDGDYVYVFLNESADGVFQDAVRLARVNKNSIENKSAYQYYDGTNWVADIRASSRVMSMPGGFNGASVVYNDFLGKWTAVYTTNNFNTVAVKTAANIWGPWSSGEKVLVDCAALFPSDVDLRCYFGRQHSEFTKDNGRVIYITYVNQKNYQVYLHEVEFVDGANCLVFKEPDVAGVRLASAGGGGFGGGSGGTTASPSPSPCAQSPVGSPTPTPQINTTPIPSPTPTVLPTPTPTPTPTSTPSPSTLSCSINPDSTTVGGTITVSGNGFSPGSYALSMIGVFLTPIVDLGNFDGTSATVTIPATQGGLYRVRVLVDGNFVYCSPNLAIN